MSITLRRMRTEDVDAVLAIERASFTTPWSETSFRDETARDDRWWVVAADDGEVFGYAGVAFAPDEAHLLNLAVRRDVRGAGLGGALLSAALEEAVRRGRNRMTLEVRKGNREARRLYESAGFIPAGRRRGYYPFAAQDRDAAEDALIMWSGDLTSEEWTARRRRLAERARSALEQRSVPAPGLILAVETSCDETAASVVARGRDIRSNVVATQVDFHRRFGGVVPEIASRKHIEAISGVVEEALEQAGVGLRDLTALAVTQGPGLVGALVVGVAYAKGLAFSTGLPLVGVNHLEGHMFANLLADTDFSPPFVSLVVSGGHTFLVHVPHWGEYRVLGKTLDDAAGEAFDKVAKALGLGYPGGPAISRLAEDGDPAAIDFPRAMMHSGDFTFSLSGLKTAVITYLRKEEEAGRTPDPADVAASFEQAVVDVQVAKSVRAAKQTGVHTFSLAGGVAANAKLRLSLREALEAEGVSLSVPPLGLCTDNAAMIAAAAHFRLAAGQLLDLDADAIPDMALA